jgi:hypothetical protein
LGGQGPDEGAAVIRFRNVSTTQAGYDIDLVVTNRTEYLAHNTTKNGEKDCFGFINVKATSSVELSFRFVRSGTSESVELLDSLFTVYDIDESNKGMKEEVTFTTPVSQYFLMPNSELVTTGNSEEGLTFTSTVIGDGKDNPKNPENLTVPEEIRAVTVKYDGVAEYILTFSAIGEQGSGRNFMFAGKSSLITDAEGECVPAPTPAPTPAPPNARTLAGCLWTKFDYDIAPLKGMSLEDLRSKVRAEVGKRDGVASVNTSRGKGDVGLLNHCYYTKDIDLRVALERNGWRRQDAAGMSQDDRRNSIIVGLHNRDGKSISYYQKQSNEELARLSMSVSLRDCLISHSWRDASTAASMKHDDCRNTVIVDLNKRDGNSISDLQGKDDNHLMNQVLNDLEYSRGFR